MKDLLNTLLNTAFWFGLHFGTAGAVCALPKDMQTQWFDPNRRFFTVSDWEMRVFRKIGLPKWKDRLPQFNPEFDKRHLKSGLVFCLLSADRTAWLIRYAVIALAIQLANLPFAWIQRYNRKRLLSVRKRLSLRIEI